MTTKLIPERIREQILHLIMESNHGMSKRSLIQTTGYSSRIVKTTINYLVNTKKNIQGKW